MIRKNITNINYDLNGNISSIFKAGIKKIYAYYTNMNRLRNTDGSGDDYVYDANGNITIATPKNIPSIDYDPFTQMTKSITVTGTPSKTMTFNYSADNERVLKTESSGN